MAESYSGILEEMTIDQVRGLKPDVAVIPIGSTEPHGPALPYGTDSYRAEAIACGATREANRQGGRVVCLPTVRISLNNNFRAFPFACRMQVSTFMALLKDLVKMCEADAIEKVVFMNAHGGNPDVIRAAMRDLTAADGAFVCLIQASSCASLEARQVCEKPSDHAGEDETSQMLYLRPDLVHSAKIGDNPRRRAGAGGPDGVPGGFCETLASLHAGIRRGRRKQGFPGKRVRLLSIQASTARAGFWPNCPGPTGIAISLIRRGSDILSRALHVGRRAPGMLRFTPSILVSRPGNMLPFIHRFIPSGCVALARRPCPGRLAQAPCQPGDSAAEFWQSIFGTEHRRRI